MGRHRDLLWFQSGTNHFTSTVASGSVTLESITANATNSRTVEPADSWVQLRGNIEQLVVKSSAAVTVGVVFFSGAGGAATTPADHKAIDWHIFTATDFKQMEAGAYVAAVNILHIGYQDADQTKKFHIGLWGTTTGIPLSAGGDIAIEWAWRPDAGEN